MQTPMIGSVLTKVILVVEDDYIFAPTIPTVVLTGTADNDVALSALKNGAEDYLPKGSFDAGTLCRSVNYAIASNAACLPERFSQGHAGKSDAGSSGLRLDFFKQVVETQGLVLECRRQPWK